MGFRGNSREDFEVSFIMAIKKEIWEKVKNGVFVIAEIGKNFIETEEEKPVAEYLENAKRLVDAAADAGADAVKFQTHTVEDEVMEIPFTSPHFSDPKQGKRHVWVSRNTAATPVKEFWRPLKQHCEKRGILFFSTPMSRGAAKRLHEEVGVPLWKVGSGDILDFVMLDYLRKTGLPILLSSGMSTYEEVKRAIEFAKKDGTPVALFHCVSRYPCPPEALSLSTIEFYRENFNLPVGFSDHSLGYESALLAAALGATIIEKHFSFSREKFGADHNVSMTPAEFKKMTHGLREIVDDPEKRRAMLQSEFARRALGAKEKILQEEEAVFRPLFRKSLVAARDVKAGETLVAGYIYAMRPQSLLGGVPSEDYEALLGRRLKKDLKKYDVISSDNLA